MVDGKRSEFVNASTCHRTDAREQIVEKISIDCAANRPKLPAFDSTLFRIQSIQMKLAALRNSNSNNAQSAQNLCGVIERSG